LAHYYLHRRIGEQAAIIQDSEGQEAHEGIGHGMDDDGLYRQGDERKLSLRHQQSPPFSVEGTIFDNP
jgi:hypothetical protein